MNRTELIKKLLPGFIPLFVFIAADEIWGTKIGLIVALSVGCIELAITYWREKRFDRFVLIDTALLMALGGISILLDNDIFFKLKPAIIEGLLCAVLGLSAFTKFDLMGGMTQRYLKGIEMTETLQIQFKKTLKSMFWIFSGHTLLVLFSAFFMSKEAWAFISGGLFYILFAVYFLYEYRNQKKKKNNQAIVDAEEWLPVVDEKGAVTGKALRSACHNGSKLLHPVVHLHVLNASKHIYLQKRPENKLIQPGKWDTAVGGHIAFGENLETSLKRESWEEIGLKDFNAKLVGEYVFESDVERELVFTFITHDYKGIHLHTDEVTEGKFWSPKQIEQNLGKDVFTPNFELEYRKFFLNE
jgi:isopentenyldiphosphate isomerase/intracellular septation protein A